MEFQCLCILINWEKKDILSLDKTNIILNLLDIQGNSLCVEANVLDCDIIVIEFKLQSLYYVHFWTTTFGKGMETFYQRG